MNTFIFECLSSYLHTSNDFDVSAVKTLTRNHGYGEKNIISSDTMFDVDAILGKIETLVTNLESDIEQSRDLLDKFEHMAENVNMDPCNFSVKLYDTNTIRSIHPSYLTGRLENIPVIIDGIIQKKIDQSKLGSMIHDNNASIVLKKNLVRTSMSPEAELTELPNTTSGEQGYDVDRMFLLDIAIPFLKELQEKKVGFSKALSGLKETGSNLKTKISAYTKALHAMNSKGNLDSDTLNLLNQFMYNEIKTVHHCFYYMCHMLLVELTSCEYNIGALRSILDRIDDHEIEDRSYTMSESVMSGTMLDMTAEDIAFPMIEGDVSPMISVLRKCVNTHYSGYMMNSKNTDKFIDVNLVSASYDKSVYEETESMFNAILIGLTSLEKNMKDIYMSFDDVIEKCGFSGKFEDRFASILVKIKNITPYTSMENHYNSDKIFFSVLKELTEAENVHWNDIGDLICTIHKNIIDLRTKIEHNMNNEFPNKEMNREMIQYLFDLDGKVKDLVGDVGCRYLYRYNDLSSFAEKTYDRTEDLVVIDVTESGTYDYIDTTDYMDYVHDSALETISLSNSYAMYEANRAYNDAIMKAKYGFLMEAEPAQTPQPTQTQQPANKPQDTKPANSVNVQQDTSKMGDDDIKKNNEAAAKSDTSNNQKSDEEQKKTFREKIKEMLDKCQKFFNTVIGKFTNAFNLKKVINTKFLTANKDAILNRSFNGVVLNIPPYDMYDPSGILSDIQSISTTVSNLSVSDFATLTDETAIYGKLLPSVNANGKSFSEYLPSHYRFGKEHQTDDKGKYQTIEYKNSALKSLAEKMIAFCEEYNNGGVDNLQNEIKNLKSSTENKLNSLSSGSDENTSTEVITAIGQVSTAIQSLTGIMMNAYRDRYNDYMKALHGLVPRKTKTSEEQPPADNANTEPTDNQDQGTDQNTDGTV